MPKFFYKDLPKFTAFNAVVHGPHRTVSNSTRLAEQFSCRICQVLLSHGIVYPPSRWGSSRPCNLGGGSEISRHAHHPERGFSGGWLHLSLKQLRQCCGVMCYGGEIFRHAGTGDSNGSRHWDRYFRYHEQFLRLGRPTFVRENATRHGLLEFSAGRDAAALWRI